MTVEEMIKQYNEGASTTEIANRANISARYVRLLLKENKVEMRPRGSWKRKYLLNENYFKTWSNNMAYILGFITADGVIAKGQQVVSISQKEKAILEEIREELGSNQPLYKNEHTGVHLLNLNSKVIKDDLLNIHGITPNKSFTVQFPKVPEEYLHHFIRGYFDGDGNIYERGFFVSFVGGSYSFMNTLLLVLRNNGFNPILTSKDKHFRVYVSGRRTIQLFANWIYNNKGLYLKRKYDQFQKEKTKIKHLEDKNKKEPTYKRIFLREFKYYQSIDKACHHVGINKQTFNEWLAKDKNFNNFLAIHTK